MLMLVLLAGCADLPRQLREPTLPVKAAEPVLPPAAETLGLNKDAVTEVTTTAHWKDNFIIQDIEPSDPLPNLHIHSLSLANATVYEAIRSVLSGTNIPFVVNPALQVTAVSGSGVTPASPTPATSPSTFTPATPQAPGMAGANGAQAMPAAAAAAAPSTNVQGNSSMPALQDLRINAVNLNGSLTKVMNILANSGGFFYTYKDGILTVSPTRQFMVTLPPIPESFAGIQQTVQSLGAAQALIDPESKMLVFQASKPTYRKIAAYLDHLKKTRSLITFDTYIYEVDLNDQHSTGIQWNQFQFASGKGAVNLMSGTSPLTNGVSVSTLYNAGRFSLNLLSNFLASQGTLKLITQPKISMLEGGSSTFDVGQTTNYVSSIGASTTTSSTQTTVNTSSVLSGVKMTLTADVENGTIYSKIQLNISELLRLNSFSAMGTTLQLPETSNRDIQTQVRIRPGDSVMLAGINITRDNQDSSGLAGLKNLFLPTSINKERQRTELVIVLRPRVVRFVSKGDKQ